MDENKRKIIPFFMIDPTGLFKSSWNIIILVLVIFQSVVVPVRIAFEDNISTAWKTADYIMDAIFFTDIIVNFLCALETDQGDLIIDRKAIAIEYLKGWFWIDFLSTIPITLI
jgi:hypothetical protein